MRRTVASALALASSGSVAVRVLPPDREYVGTVLVRTGDDEFRAEVNLDGSIRSDFAGTVSDSNVTHSSMGR